MNIIYNEFILIILYSFIQLSLSDLSSDNSNISISSNDCSSFSDCFNCTINRNCRWNSSNEECVPYDQNNSNIFLPLINHSFPNITILNNYFNFIRKVCYLSTTPMINSNNTKQHNNKITEYCGEHYIIASYGGFDKNFKIELKNINGSYGTPNLLCEYIFFSGPDNFDINININQKDSNKFYFLYSKDSLNFTKHINKSTIQEIQINPNILNTFLFYSLESFNSPPFTITYKPNFWKKTVQATGYIMLALIIVIIAVIIFAIIYMRKHISIFIKTKKDKKKATKKFKNLFNKSKGEEFSLMKKRSSETNITGPSLIKNFTPETPIGFLDKNQFSYEKCAFDGLFLNNNDDIIEAKCGHFYHKNCYNKLLETNKDNKDEKEIKCVICNKNIIKDN